MPLGSLTYWFATKDDLLREALRRFVGEEAERLRGIAEQLGSGAGPAEIAERFASVLEDGRRRPSRSRSSSSTSRRRATRRCATSPQESFRAYEEVAVAALRAAGVADPERLAPLFVSLADGLGAAAHGGRDGAAGRRDAARALPRRAGVAGQSSRGRRERWKRRRRRSTSNHTRVPWSSRSTPQRAASMSSIRRP